MSAVKGFYGIARTLSHTLANNNIYKTDYSDYIHWLTTSDFSLNRLPFFILSPQPDNLGPIYNSTSIELGLPVYPATEAQQNSFVTNLDNNFIISLMWGDISRSTN